ncbi:MAG TPA: phytanoyl-CoA dioxygenase family protein [Candidatus Aquilonibacter sp.]|nr:phytanoyl-CoA dioxygenase family protein [Candidatus Aquilonibacter sp.]
MTVSKSSSEADLDALERDGFIVFDGVLGDDDLARARAAIGQLYERARKDPVWRVGGTLHLDGLIEMGEPFTAVWTDPRVVRAVRRLLGDDYRVVRAHVRSPLPGEGAQSLHADYPSRPAAGGHCVATAIVAIEPFTATNGATRVVPGSHLESPAGIPTDSDSSYEHEIVITMPAGSALLFSGHLYHSGTRNRSHSWRDALQITFARDDARYYA